MMKVILLSATPPPRGGIGTWTLRLIKSSSNIEYTLIDGKLTGKRSIYAAHFKKNFFNDIIRCLKIWSSLLKNLITDNAMIVHSCIPATVTAMLKETVCAHIVKIFHRKFVLHFHCTLPIIQNKCVRLSLLKHLCNISDTIIVLNNKSYDATKNYIPTACMNKVHIIPNFVLPDEISKNHIIKKEIKTALFVGGVIEEKGATDILKIAPKFPNIEFRLVGIADENIKVVAKKIKNVTLLGERKPEYIHNELMSADIFIFLTHFQLEGFSVALLEAMAAGLPCIATDWAANSDMLRNDGGVIVPVHDLLAVERAINFMEDPFVREKMSVRNIETVRNLYSSSAIISMFENIYKTLC